MKKFGYLFGLIIGFSIIVVACQQENAADPTSDDALFKAAKEKVMVCHLDEYGEWITINISQNALSAHLAHGDMVYFPYPGTYTWNYYYGSGTYTHTMIIEEASEGMFTGHGYYNANPAYTWDIVDGTYDEDGNVSFRIDYTGLNGGYFLDCTGMFMCGDGVSGEASGSGQTGTWDATMNMD